MIIKFDNLTESEFLEKFLNMVNLLSPPEKSIATSEAQLLIEFLLLPDEKFKYQRFSSLAKTKVIQSAASKNWNLTKINVNNKIYSLIDKGFLRRDTDGVIYIAKYILAALASYRANKTFEIKITFNDKEYTPPTSGNSKGN
jgi:hypothetical protein